MSQVLEVKSLPGRRLVAASPKACIWSDDADAAVSNRRVTVQYIAVAGFDMVKSRAGHISIEPAPGLGDDAYYQSANTKESPILAVRKGNLAIQIRILNGLKTKPFTREQEMTKEAELAKIAVGKL